MVVTNLKYAREKRQPKTHVESKLKDSRFKGNFRVIAQRGNQVEIKPLHGGETSKFHITDIKKVLLADQAIAQLPDYNQLGRLTKLKLNPKDIPDLGWDPQATLNRELDNI